MNILIKYTKQAIILLIFAVITGCGIYKKVDARKVSPNVNDRVQKNIQEGRSFKLFDSDKPRGGDFQFASSNELWRASLDVIDFMPLSSVNYSGGIIITDWYDENDSKSSVKITVKFLSNEIRPDGLEVLVYKKNCKSFESCQTNKENSKINSELKFAILKKAAQIEKTDLEKKNN